MAQDYHWLQSYDNITSYGLSDPPSTNWLFPVSLTTLYLLNRHQSVFVLFNVQHETEDGQQAWTAVISSECSLQCSDLLESIKRD